MFNQKHGRHRLMITQIQMLLLWINKKKIKIKRQNAPSPMDVVYI